MSQALRRIPHQPCPEADVRLQKHALSCSKRRARTALVGNEGGVAHMVEQERGMQVSVLTSSSPLPLYKLADCLRDDPVDAIEIYAFRSIDIRGFSEKKLVTPEWANRDQLPSVNTAELIEQLSDAQIDAVAGYLHDELKTGAAGGEPLRVSAIATFFPEIASSTPSRRQTTITALQKMCRLASRLGAHCVEMVGGLRLDWCDDCNNFGPGGAALASSATARRRSRMAGARNHRGDTTR